ncbi:lysophospholipase [Kitasatospora herbaricolor]|uniref:DUF459 domain-containing protein n=1 Tax=Kitasatospora herbaricolor TaxID=68217 RepID=UPI0017483A1F|nr:GDSL-type esterase/lipase family protein [Kitasatospora herbaricolor]MDQ0306869.1 lysophospholipase L1-like esterase [Kitasatospora herbaricolor]GGV19550.1 lysophospholipase [Kitasatospora herbaricolor]
MTRDLRICFVGDSLVAGVGDPVGLGWAGRLGARAFADGLPSTHYNLGVRRETSADIVGRWEDECARRLRHGTDLRVVLCFGVNDATHESDRPRVAPERSAANLATMLDRAAARGWRAMVVSPPPVADPAHSARTALLDEDFARVCRTAGVPYVSVHRALSESAVWMRQVTLGDGAHPGAEGYEEYATLLDPHWRAWLAASG